MKDRLNLFGRAFLGAAGGYGYTWLYINFFPKWLAIVFAAASSLGLMVLLGHDLWRSHLTSREIEGHLQNLLREPSPAKPPANPGCRYYGKNGMRGHLLPGGHNQCGLIRDTYTPCEMEIDGRRPDERVCPVIAMDIHNRQLFQRPS